MKYFLKTIFRLSFPALLALSCEKTAGISDTGGESLSPSEKSTRSAVRYFAGSVVNTYYLWRDEVASSWGEWREYDEPIEAMRKLRYKDEDGNDVDRWSTLTDNFASFHESVSGVETTYGYNFRLYYSQADRSVIEAVVTYVYRDSPAAEAGLRRGDAIVMYNGQSFTEQNFAELAYGMYYSPSCSLTLRGGATLSLVARKMYEDPVILHTIIDAGGKKIAYLHYTSFTVQSIPSLAQAFALFREAGATDLVLDLRYNGGGYVNAELALASMIAPEKEVAAGSVHTLDIYNETLREAWGESERRFSTKVEYTDGNGARQSLDLSGTNCNFERVAVIFTGDSASASEALITGLLPYMDITMVGERTHGKYCTGLLMSAADWYSDMREYISSARYSAGMQYSADWGIYLMFGRYADKNGRTPCMPDGFAPDIAVEDRPYEGIGFGNPEETMLKAAIGAITLSKASAESIALPENGRDALRLDFRDGGRGYRIDDSCRERMLVNRQK